METIRGRTSRELNTSEFHQIIAGYDHIELDLGTGDGRFVRSMTARHRDRFFIGLDACRENLRADSRRTPANALFVIAGAQALPVELEGLVSQVYVNFPWGSLLDSLLSDRSALMGALYSVTRPCAGMDIRLNGEALAAAGWDLEPGVDQIQSRLSAAGWRTRTRVWMDAGKLRAFPSTWSKRLAFGRDPRAVLLSAQKE